MAQNYYRFLTVLRLHLHQPLAPFRQRPTLRDSRRFRVCFGVEAGPFRPARLLVLRRDRSTTASSRAGGGLDGEQLLLEHVPRLPDDDRVREDEREPEANAQHVHDAGDRGAGHLEVLE